MARGGARNRSGPPPDPTSGRSDRRGFKLTALPSEGYRDEVPDFPLPAASDREVAVWLDLWSTPQACAWSMQSWRWGQIADMVRVQVRGENPGAPVGVYAALRAARADLGLTPAGLKENGWAIAVDAVAEKREANEDAATSDAARPSSRDRIKAVPDVG